MRSYLAKWNKPPAYSDGSIFEIKCRLIPLNLTLLVLFIMLVVSSVSWLVAMHFAHHVGPLTLISGLFQLLVIVCVIGSATKLKMLVNDKGLLAQNSFHRDSLYDRGARKWSDVHSVRLKGVRSPLELLNRLRGRDRLGRQSPFISMLQFFGRGWNQQGFLVLDFKSGGMVAFPLAGFARNDLEGLFIALSRFADPICLNAEVISLQRDILTGQHMNLTSSYTKMWETSLNQRFEVTNFVPLMGGATLKDGALTILMLLSCGGVSSVYLARDDAGARFIVKELSVPDDEGNAKLHELFNREARILATLSHPGIASVRDHFVEHGRDYLVLDYIAGLSLRQHVDMHGPFTEKEVLRIAESLFDILDYLHGVKPPVIHRDITPDNLIIAESDRKITLIDFGAASEFTATLTGTMIGKQCYIPPEQFQGKAVPQSDIYAAGATLYFLLTGKEPTPISVSKPSQLIAVNKSLDDLIASMTALDPGARPVTATDCLALLKGVAVK